ncbi:hypothetical protein EDB86DRAFT_2830807 [Lactarius hatsudake]|nr:hypothetical protein EDB86DRAFT_2830807 [Lactarius hatsudake]
MHAMRSASRPGPSRAEESPADPIQVQAVFKPWVDDVLRVVMPSDWTDDVSGDRQAVGVRYGGRNGVCPQDSYDEFWFEEDSAGLTIRDNVNAWPPNNDFSAVTMWLFWFLLWPVYTVQIEATSDDLLTPE